MYSQFIYGKLSYIEPTKVLARTPDLKDTDDLKRIADKYKFWQADLRQRSRETGKPKQAVGIVVDSESQKLLLIQAQQIREEDYEHDRYRYVFIPLEETLNNLPFCIDRLLQWLSSQRLSMKPENRLEPMGIDPLDSCELPDYSKETEDIVKCLEEKYKVDEKNYKPYLTSAILALLNEQRVLINRVENHLSPTEYYLKGILHLLPTKCRTDLSIVVGDFNERICGWAKLLIKTINPDSINEKQLPNNLVWLCRKQEKLISSNALKSHDSHNYVKKIEDILLQPDQEWIEDLLRELDTFKGERLPLHDINNLFEGRQSDNQTIKLGLWGIPGAGKTIYITQLYECMQKDSSGFNIRVNDETSDIFIQTNSQELAKGNLGLLTVHPVEGEFLKTIKFYIEPLYTLFKKSFILTFVEAPGEVYESIGEVEGGIYRPNPWMVDSTMDIVGYLVQCDGIIFLLDPNLSDYGTYPQSFLVPRVLEALRYHSHDSIDAKASNLTPRLDDIPQLKKFIAFCVTKVDQEEEWWNERENPEKLVSKILGDAIDKIGNSCLYSPQHSDDPTRHRCKFFALSSIGRYQDDHKKWQPVVEIISSNNDDSDRENDDTPDKPDGWFSDNSDNSPEEINEEEEWFPKPPKQQRRERERVRLKKEVYSKSKPFNVIEPIKWLIRELQVHPLEDNQAKNN